MRPASSLLELPAALIDHCCGPECDRTSPALRVEALDCIESYRALDALAAAVDITRCASSNDRPPVLAPPG